MPSASTRIDPRSESASWTVAGRRARARLAGAGRRRRRRRGVAAVVAAARDERHRQRQPDRERPHPTDPHRPSPSASVAASRRGDVRARTGPGSIRARIEPGRRSPPVPWCDSHGCSAVRARRARHPCRVLRARGRDVRLRRALAQRPRARRGGGAGDVRPGLALRRAVRPAARHDAHVALRDPAPRRDRHRSGPRDLARARLRRGDPARRRGARLAGGRVRAGAARLADRRGAAPDRRRPPPGRDRDVLPAASLRRGGGRTRRPRGDGQEPRVLRAAGAAPRAGGDGVG